MIMNTVIKCLTTIPKGSRAKRSETREIFVRKIVIWSALHGDMQLLVRAGSVLRTLLNKMSCDSFLGLPFNIASYALLLEMLCFVSGRKARELSISFGDLHIYDNHREQVATQLTRISYPLPTVTIEAERKDSWLETLLSLEYSNIKLDNYKHHPALPAPVAV